MAVQSWEKLLKIADRKAPELVRAFLAWVADIKDFASARQIAEALRRGNIQAAIEVIPWDQVAADKLQPQAARILRDIVERAGELDMLPGKAASTFDIVNPKVFEFIKSETGKLITNVTNETKSAVRAIIEDGFRTGEGKLGQGPRAIAEDIVAHIGINERQARALLKYREDLLAQGAPNVETLVDRYHARLLKQRALTIARTESLTAANAAQKLKWADAKAKGLLDPERWEVAWIVFDPCPLCESMAEETRPVDGLYSGGELAGTDGPPAHPNCRCSEVLERKASEAGRAA